MRFVDGRAHRRRSCSATSWPIWFIDVMGHVAMHRPVAGVVGDEFHGARAADGDQHGVGRVAGRFLDDSAVGFDEQSTEIRADGSDDDPSRRELPKRMRTRSPSLATSGSVAG